MITDVSVDVPGTTIDKNFVAAAKLDLMGEITRDAGRGPHFERGVANYPAIGDGAAMMSNADLRVIYELSGSGSINVGHLQQDSSIGGFLNGTELVGRHFAMLGTTGVGKSSGVAIILHELQRTRPDLRIFLVDPHNEYGRFFGETAQVFTPRNVKLPFWLFNFEEIVDVFFGARPGIERKSRFSPKSSRSRRACTPSTAPAPPTGWPPSQPIPGVPASPPIRRCRTAWSISSA